MVPQYAYVVLYFCVCNLHFKYFVLNSLVPGMDISYFHGFLLSIVLVRCLG